VVLLSTGCRLHYILLLGESQIISTNDFIVDNNPEFCRRNRYGHEKTGHIRSFRASHSGHLATGCGLVGSLGMALGCLGLAVVGRMGMALVRMVVVTPHKRGLLPSLP